jgi:hypothetical protein
MKYYPSKGIERLKKTTTIPSQDRLSPGLDLNVGPPDYEAEALNIRLKHETIFFFL